MLKHIQRISRNTMCLLVGCLLLGTSTAAVSGDYTRTKHPVVLVHGFSGFDTALGVDYWYGIAGKLERSGATVYASNNSSFNDSTVRGEQLVSFLEDLSAIYGHRKFNLIGHSQGGFDIRYAASVRPDLVASVTAVGSPTTGNGLATYLTENIPSDSLTYSLFVNGVNFLGTFVEGASHDSDPQDADQSRYALTYAGASEFVSKHPQGIPTDRCANGEEIVNGIRYFSFSGVKPFNNIFDASDYLMATTSAFANEVNDGLAGRCASHVGKVLKDNYHWNHIDEINHLFGIRGWGAANPVSVYRTHVNRLKKLGL